MNTVKEIKPPNPPRWSTLSDGTEPSKETLRGDLIAIRKIAVDTLPAGQLAYRFLFDKTPEGAGYWGNVGFHSDPLTDAHRARLLEMADELQAYLDAVEGGA